MRKKCGLSGREVDVLVREEGRHLKREVRELERLMEGCGITVTTTHVSSQAFRDESAALKERAAALALMGTPSRNGHLMWFCLP